MVPVGNCVGISDRSRKNLREEGRIQTRVVEVAWVRVECQHKSCLPNFISRE